jgi:hypothetical protein
MSVFTVASLHALQQVKSTTHTLKLPNDKDTTERKAAEGPGTRTKRVKRLPSDNDTKEGKAAERQG